ncbi:hypothetical protein BDW59DRAFT_162605 [Aspergillus cavernicola]|uniref:DUF6594 domain-containing protein n=1 Tax=Aspergillus cavernicola TaxID=176166 RepID=A0ABR4I9C6_9EURO
MSGQSPSTPVDLQPPAKDEISEKLWKYLGCTQKVIASSTDFDVLNERMILRLQDGAAEIEQELEELDEIHSRRTAEDVHNGTFWEDSVNGREKLYDRALHKLYTYNRFMQSCNEVRKLPKTTDRNKESLRNWHANHKGTAINEREAGYVEQDDLASMVPSSKCPLQLLLEHSSHFRRARLWREQNPMHGQDNMHYYSDEKIQLFVQTVTMLTTLVMILVPFWVLVLIESMMLKVGICTLLICIFSPGVVWDQRTVFRAGWTHRSLC